MQLCNTIYLHQKYKLEFCLCTSSNSKTHYCDRISLFLYYTKQQQKRNNNALKNKENDIKIKFVKKFNINFLILIQK